jgi:hypothetical protein
MVPCSSPDYGADRALLFGDYAQPFVAVEPQILRLRRAIAARLCSGRQLIGGALFSEGVSYSLPPSMFEVVILL